MPSYHRHGPGPHSQRAADQALRLAALQQELMHGYREEINHITLLRSRKGQSHILPPSEPIAIETIDSQMGVLARSVVTQYKLRHQ